MVALERIAEYPGMPRTPRPINRERELQQIREAIQGQGLRVLCLRGKGGIGKTYLLQAILSWCQPGGEWHVPGLLALSPHSLVDLYHTTYHTVPGLTEGLRQGLNAPEGSFEGFDEAYRDWQEKRFGLAGMLKELETLRGQIGEAFLEDLNALSRSHRLVLALDTVERLMYEEDAVQQRLGLEPEGVDALQWLLKALPRMENTVVLLAGRPEAERLYGDLQSVLGERFVPIDLGPLDLKGTMEYLDAVADTLRQQGLAEQAERIARIPTETREVVWKYTEGRPILLALVTDYLAVADSPPAWAKEPPDTVRALGAKELAARRRQVEADLVRFWQQTARAADQAISAMAWTRKGITPDLLARIQGVDEETTREWLETIRGFSFVKLRRTNGHERWFLHDEMYELLETHVLKAPPEVDRRPMIYQTILDWYGERIRSARERVRELWTPRRSGMPDWDLTPTGQPRPPDQPEELARATDLLYNLMAEEVHYRLLRDPQDGFQTYQLYAKEAFWASEESLDHLLRSELLWFLKRHPEQKAFDGLRREEMEVELALRRLERYNRARDKRAIEYASRIHQECADILRDAGPLASIWLNALEGETLLYLGEELSRAQKLLLDAAQALEALAPASSFEDWRRRTLLAEACNNLGYLYHTLGWFQKATEWYGRAVTIWRQLEDEEKDLLRRMALRAQHANTLNNQAWALAELGHFDRAARMAEDALDLRQRLGSAAPVAFSLNTLGMIETRADQPHRARVHCSRALSIFRSLQQPRGVGLAEIALAEALRRLTAIPNLYAPEEGADLLREARGYLDDAVEIFSPQGPVPERPRLVEALIERGCLYRLWAWLRLNYEYEAKDDPSPEELIRRSEEDLRRAMVEAGSTLPFRRLDAQVNLAWLYYYIRNEDQAEVEARQALDEIPEEYRLPLKADRGQLVHTFYWFLSGKTYLLLGQVAMRRFASAKNVKREQEELENYLRQAGEHFTVALAYDELFAYEFREIRRATRSIYERLRGLNQQEMGAVHQGIAAAVQKYGLREPTRMDRVLFNHNLPTRPGVTFDVSGPAIPV